MALEIGSRVVVSSNSSPMVSSVSPLVSLPPLPPGATLPHNSSEAAALQSLMAAHTSLGLGPAAASATGASSIEHLLNNYAAVAMAQKQLQAQHQQQAEEAQLFLRALSAAACSTTSTTISGSAPDRSGGHAASTAVAVPSSIFSPSSSSSSTSLSPQPQRSEEEAALQLLSPSSSMSPSESTVRVSSSPSPLSSSLVDAKCTKTDTLAHYHLNNIHDHHTTTTTNNNMGRPEPISPPQSLALASYGRFAAMAMAAAASRKSPLSAASMLATGTSMASSPLEKLQSLSPNTIAFAANQAAAAAAAAHQARLLKFSIDNILSPEFGRNEANRNLFLSYYYQQYTNSLNLAVKQQQQQHQTAQQYNGQASLHVNHHHNTQSHQHKLPFDINTLVSNAAAAAAANRKRKRSDSESSTISSISDHSKETTKTLNKNKRSANNNTNNNNKTCSVSASPATTTTTNNNNNDHGDEKEKPLEEKLKDTTQWPAWVFCTRYSDRPSSGPRSRKIKKKEKKDEKRPRTAFTAEQLARLKQEFQENRYLTEKRRQDLARELKLNESQIKIWFQNKRAKIKKTTTGRNPLAMHLMAQGLYNHSTMAIDSDEEYDEDFKSCSPKSESTN